MSAVQERSSPALEDFNALVKNLHNAIDVIASQVVDTIETRDPSLVSDKPSPPAPSELLSAFGGSPSCRTNFRLTPRLRRNT